MVSEWVDTVHILFLPLWPLSYSDHILPKLLLYLGYDPYPRITFPPKYGLILWQESFSNSPHKNIQKIHLHKETNSQIWHPQHRSNNTKNQSSAMQDAIKIQLGTSPPQHPTIQTCKCLIFSLLGYKNQQNARFYYLKWLYNCYLLIELWFHLGCHKSPPPRK